MVLIEFILLVAYLFALFGTFFPNNKAKSETPPEKELEDAVLKYLVHINKKASNKTE